MKPKLKTALLIIDMQKKWISDSKTLYPPMRMAVDLINKLREVWADSGLPIFYVTLVHEPDGSTLSRFDSKLWNIRGSIDAEIIDELKPKANERVLIKHRYSAFFETELASTLRKEGIDSCVITGYQARACILATALDAYQLDFEAHVVENAILDTNEAQLNFHLATFRDAGLLKKIDEVLKVALA